MNVSPRSTVWLSRIILAAITLVLTSICFKFLLSPVPMAMQFGLAPTSSLGVTSIRVALGAFPMTLGFIAIYCLFTSRFVAGLSIVAVLMSLILTVRFYAGLTGGVMAESTFVIYAECTLLTLSLLGLYLERNRGRAVTVRRLGEPG